MTDRPSCNAWIPQTEAPYAVERGPKPMRLPIPDSPIGVSRIDHEGPGQRGRQPP